MIAAEMDTDDMQQNNNQPRRSIDRQIPVGVLIVLLLNLGAGVWFAATYASMISQNHIEIESVKDHNKIVDDQIVDIKTSLAVLKDRSKDSQDTVHRIEDMVSQNKGRH